MTEGLVAAKVWLAKMLADLCEIADDDSIIVEVAVMASNMLKERRGAAKGWKLSCGNTRLRMTCFG
jgi:hypothetical protein